MKKIFSKSAFSLIELSIVILVIGILVIGITQGSRILYQAKLKSAQSLTTSSPVASMDGLAYWLDSTSATSFDDVEQIDGSVVTNWYDINPQSQTKNNFSGSGTSRPNYVKKCINDLPCVDFNGANYLGITNPNTNYLASQLTIFIVLKIDVLPTGSDSASLIMANGVWPSTGEMHFQIGAVPSTLGFGVSNRVPADIWTFTKTTYAANKTYIIATVDNSNTITAFVNGVNDMNPTQTITTSGNTRTYDVKIGGYFDGTSIVATRYLNGRIGEIIVFNRGLKSNEITSVNRYLGAKWGIDTP